jgi:hypothetical protein
MTFLRRFLPRVEDSTLMILAKSLAALWIWAVVYSVLLEVAESVTSIPMDTRATEDRNLDIDHRMFTILIAPAIETALFQTVPVKVFGLFSGSRLLPILVSGALFGALHYATVWSILDATVAGCFFTWLYILMYDANRRPYFTVYAVHGLYNLTVYLLLLAYLG